METIIDKIKRKYAIFKGGETYLNYLRKQGIKIGKRCTVGPARTMAIDASRPYMVEIGDDVRLNYGLTIMTHDIATLVFKNRFGDFIPSSGKVKIGNNVYFGRNCTVLKGVTIGNNCIIGYGSLVMRDVPDNSVVAGSPAKVICTLEQYYEKRKEKAIEEAFALAREIQRVYNRKPVPADFREEFVYFVSGDEVGKYPEIPIKFQLTTMGDCYERWTKEHKAPYKSFDEFLKAAGVADK